MTIAPHSGIIDFGTFTPPTVSRDGIQGEVPAPLIAEITYVLSATGWVPMGGGGGGGTVTSVSGTGTVNGITLTGTVTNSGSLTLGGTLSGVSLTSQVSGVLPIANGGTNATSASGALTSLGAYPASNPNGYTSNVGTVTSVSGAGSVNGITLTGTVNSSGSLTLGGTLSGVSLTSQVSDTLPIANGGTNASTAGAARTSLGAAALGANTDITSIALTSGTIATAPASGTDIANKAYVDSISAGINFHQAVRLASVAALPAYTYNNGSGGVGATITANANAALSVDSVAVVAGNRVLIKNEVGGNAPYNGVYDVTQTGSGATPFILTRSADYDTVGTGVNEINQGDFFLVTAGSTQANTSWVQQTPLPITIGTTALTFTQFAAPIVYSAGTGLTLTGTVFSITNTGVTANTYGSASSVPVIAFNAQGQATGVTDTAIAIAASQITSGTLGVARGGTGATTLTGYVKGTGTAALTASSTIPASDIGSGAALTKTDDTNVTLTLGGTPASALLAATSITAGLTGQLSVARGGTGASTLTGVVIGNGTSAFTTVSAPSGAIVGTTDTQTLTNKRLTPRVLASTANSATPTLNTDDYDMMVITGQTVTITSFTTNLSGTPTNGQKLWISITGTGAIAITWGASFEASTIALPTTTVTTNRLDVGFVWNAATSKWRCVATA